MPGSLGLGPMTLWARHVRSSQCILAAIVALTAACTVSESGAIPCSDDSNCPRDYPQCFGGGSAGGRCAEAAVGTPTLASSAIVVAPAAITGGTHPPISLSLPALSGNHNLARKVTLAVAVGNGAAEPVTKQGGAAVTAADLGTTIAVDAPPTSAADQKTFTYTLTVSNTPSSAAATTATGNLQISPAPVLAGSTITVSPAAASGGSNGAISLSLPALTSAAASAASVSLALSGCGAPGLVTKSGGGAITAADLGTIISVSSPTAASADNATCTYTLSVSNGATTPATVTAAGALTVAPVPALAAATLAVTPAVITAGQSLTISVALPALTTSPSAGNTASLAISGTGCGSGPVAKASGAPVGIADLGTTITIPAPPSSATDNKSCTYTLTVSNGLTPPATTTASGALAIKPGPVLTFTALAPSIPVITGGTTPAITIALPDSTFASAVTFTIDDGSGPVAQRKSNNALVGLTDLNTTISVNAPATSATDAKTYTYTLTVANNAAPPATATATGTLTVVPVPQLSAASFTVAPATITGATTPSLSATLPSLASTTSSRNAVTYAISGSNCGSGNVNKTNGGGGAVVIGDLGTPITFAPPATSSTTNANCTYTLTVSNGATTPVTASATGVLSIVPAPTLASNTLTVSPGVLTGGSTSNVTISVPGGASYGGILFQVDDGMGGAFTTQLKSNGNPVAAGDLGHNITVAPPASTANAAPRTYNYRLTLSNNATTPATVTAAGQLKIVPAPVLSASTFTVAPATISGGSSASLSATLPGLTSPASNLNTVTAYAISGTSCGSGNVNKTNGGGGSVVVGDLGGGITFAPPTTTTSTTSTTCTYTLTVSNGATTAVTVSATGTLSVVPAVVLNNALTVTPNVLRSGTSTASLLQFPLPTASQGTPTSVAMTVTPPGTAVTDNGTALALLPASLGTTVSVDPPSTTVTTSTSTFTFSLTAANAAGDSSAPVTTSVTTYPGSTNMANTRVGATATLLPNGKVLILGGGTSIASGVCSGATSTAEIYDPATGATTAAGNMTVARCMHTAVLASNGTTNKVYVMGGANNANIDVFNTSNNTWQPTGLPTLQQKRVGHSATLLDAASGYAGHILVAGGYDPANGNAGLATLEDFDPTASSGNGLSTQWRYNCSPSTTNCTTFTATSLSQPRGEHAAVLINGFVFFIGGWDGTAGTGGYSPTVDILNTPNRLVQSGSATNQISTQGAVTNEVARAALSAVMLDASTILVVGGYNGTSFLQTMQKYTVNTSPGGTNPATLTSVAAAVNLTTGRARFQLVPSTIAGRYLAIGGTTAYGTPDTATSSVELITAGTLAASAATSLLNPRQALTATNLAISGASSLVYLVAGGGTSATGAAEAYIAP